MHEAVVWFRRFGKNLGKVENFRKRFGNLLRQSWTFTVRQILGWSIWESLAADGALQPLSRALIKRGPPTGVIHHSDRGVQYACGEYRRQLQQQGLRASMSPKGNCYDNAAMEAFWSTLKREALDQSDQWSKDRVRRELFEYIEAVYNRSRFHSALEYQSPVDFEQRNN